METNTEPKTLEQVVEYCQFHNFPAEIVGSWVWLSFESKPPVETIALLKEYGFRYSPRRKKWAHNCGTPTKSARATNPWEKYEHFSVSEYQTRKAAIV
jgi:hypothetical protein